MARYLDRWDSRRPLEPWLVAIAGNRCRTFLARRRVHQPLAWADEPASESTGEQLAADALREGMTLALSHLPLNQRRAFELFHERSLSYGEIADELGCPVGTVKTWVHRARGHLIEHLRVREVLVVEKIGSRKIETSQSKRSQIETSKLNPGHTSAEVT